MSSILLKGYDLQGCKIQSKEGQELDEQYLRRYQCVQCKFILRWPYQMICGDRICKGCFPSSPFNCPSCEELIEPSKPQQFFTDRSCQNDIKGFIVLCKCGDWQGGLDDWELHCETCNEMVKDRPPGATPSEVCDLHVKSTLFHCFCTQYSKICWNNCRL